jgi:hypothetical protein
MLHGRSDQCRRDSGSIIQRVSHEGDSPGIKRDEVAHPADPESSARRLQAGDFWMTLEASIGQVVGKTAARLIVGEPKIWAAIFLWISGRSQRDPRRFHYSAASGLGIVSAVVLGLVILEGVFVSVLARLAHWPWLSPVLIAISAYAAVWIIGIYASLRALPHLVTEGGLLIRYGALGEAWIPWQEVDQVVRQTVTSPGGMDGLFNLDGVATFAVGGKTTLTIHRRSPGVVKGFLRSTDGVTQIRVAADDPEALLAAVTAAMPPRES